MSILLQLYQKPAIHISLMYVCIYIMYACLIQPLRLPKSNKRLFVCLFVCLFSWSRSFSKHSLVVLFLCGIAVHCNACLVIQSSLLLSVCPFSTSYLFPQWFFASFLPYPIVGHSVGLVYTVCTIFLRHLLIKTCYLPNVLCVINRSQMHKVRLPSRCSWIVSPLLTLLTIHLSWTSTVCILL